MKKTSKSNLYFLIIILLLAIGPYGMAYIYKAFGVKDPRIVMVISYFVLLFLPVIIYLAVTKSNVKEVLRLNKLSIRQVMLTILIGILCIPLGSCLASIGSYFFPNNASTTMYYLAGSTSLIVMLLIMAVMPAVIEEINLRGIILNGYNNQSILIAAIFNGLFFGIFHLDGHQFFYASVIGFVMAYVVRVTNSIFSSMIIHFIVNAESLILVKLVVDSGMYEKVLKAANDMDLTKASFDTKVSSIVSSITIAICIMGLIFLLIKKLKKENYNNTFNYQYMNNGMYPNNGMYDGNGMYSNNNMYQMQTESPVEEKENVINPSFIAIIVVYLIIMFIKL